MNLETYLHLQKLGAELNEKFMFDVYNRETRARMTEYLQQYMTAAIKLEPVWDATSHQVTFHIKFDKEEDYTWWLLQQ